MNSYQLTRLAAAERRTRRYTARPGSKLANVRIRAHQALDILWWFGSLTRSEAYSRLAACMGLPTAECHIGMFNEDQCEQVIRICETGEILGTSLGISAQIGHEKSAERSANEQLRASRAEGE